MNTPSNDVRVSNTFVRDLRKVCLINGDTENADHLLHVLRKMQQHNYDDAISYAKHEAQIDLLGLFLQHGQSGALASSWRLIEKMFNNKPNRRPAEAVA